MTSDTVQGALQYSGKKLGMYDKYLVCWKEKVIDHCQILFYVLKESVFTSFSG